MAQNKTINDREYSKFFQDGDNVGSDYSAALICGWDSDSGTARVLPITSAGLKVDTELTLSGVTIDNVKVFSTDGTAANSKYAYVDANNYVGVNILAQGLTALKVSKDANANSSTNPIYVKEVSAGSDVIVVNATGAVAINTTTAIANEFKLLKVLCHFSSAPTTSENFVVTLDSAAGAAYDTVLKSVNPSSTSSTDIVFLPEGEMKFVSGDEVKVTFTNTDTRTYGLSIYYQLV
jgi:hypothetical protein